MKKNFIYALMSAIALTGLMGLTSCAESEELDVNPGYNPETGEVVAGETKEVTVTRAVTFTQEN